MGTLVGPIAFHNVAVVNEALHGNDRPSYVTSVVRIRRVTLSQLCFIDKAKDGRRIRNRCSSEVGGSYELIRDADVYQVALTVAIGQPQDISNAHGSFELGKFAVSTEN